METAAPAHKAPEQLIIPSDPLVTKAADASDIPSEPLAVNKDVAVTTGATEAPVEGKVDGEATPVTAAQEPESASAENTLYPNTPAELHHEVATEASRLPTPAEVPATETAVLAAETEQAMDSNSGAAAAANEEVLAAEPEIKSNNLSVAPEETLANSEKDVAVVPTAPAESVSEPVNQTEDIPEAPKVEVISEPITQAEEASEAPKHEMSTTEVAADEQVARTEIPTAEEAHVPEPTTAPVVSDTVATEKSTAEEPTESVPATEPETAPAVADETQATVVSEENPQVNETGDVLSTATINEAPSAVKEPHQAAAIDESALEVIGATEPANSEAAAPKEMAAPITSADIVSVPVAEPTPEVEITQIEEVPEETQVKATVQPDTAAELNTEALAETAAGPTEAEPLVTADLPIVEVSQSGDVQLEVAEIPVAAHVPEPVFSNDIDAAMHTPQATAEPIKVAHVEPSPETPVVPEATEPEAVAAATMVETPKEEVSVAQTTVMAEEKPQDITAPEIIETDSTEPAIVEPETEIEAIVVAPEVDNEPIVTKPEVENAPVAVEPEAKKEASVTEPEVENAPAAVEPEVKKEASVTEPEVENAPAAVEPEVKKEASVTEPEVENVAPAVDPEAENVPTTVEPEAEAESIIEPTKTHEDAAPLPVESVTEEPIHDVASTTEATTSVDPAKSDYVTFEPTEPTEIPPPEAPATHEELAPLPRLKSVDEYVPTPYVEAATSPLDEAVAMDLSSAVEVKEPTDVTKSEPEQVNPTEETPVPETKAEEPVAEVNAVGEAAKAEGETVRDEAAHAQTSDEETKTQSVAPQAPSRIHRFASRIAQRVMKKFGYSHHEVEEQPTTPETTTAEAERH
ncbi:hypothetical protein IWQ60_012361 [Tieghemiomyces parasiticus]|uniref:Uncharacterized protein n=1 Tax=Tieghemiomyces parasiticus TaxID=78921 RepID=A0A9W7ZFE9_9FUNG|nr:hypothetical protein IWQ60_012361 [Tieghemiomyces parasiticus]